MGLEFKEKKIVKSLSVVARLGSFAINRSPIKFIDCRESFATKWGKRTKGFFFKHGADQGKNVAMFIYKTEQILGQTNFTSFAETNHNTILWVEPSYFWRSCKMRRQLFTIILRAGMDYDPERDNYEAAMFKHGHLSQTSNAIRRFLYGFTKYTGEMPRGSATLENMGWVRLMSSKSEAHVREVFVKSRGKTYVPDFNLRNALWL